VEEVKARAGVCRSASSAATTPAKSARVAPSVGGPCKSRDTSSSAMRARAAASSALNTPSRPAASAAAASSELTRQRWRSRNRRWASRLRSWVDSLAAREEAGGSGWAWCWSADGGRALQPPRLEEVGVKLPPADCSAAAAACPPWSSSSSGASRWPPPAVLACMNRVGTWSKRRSSRKAVMGVWC